MARAKLRQAVSWRYRRFVQRQGYVVIILLCAAVIAGSAAWTQQAGFRRLSPAPTEDAASAADLWQQSLRDAATPSPAPTAPPILWRAPVEGMTVLRGFEGDKLSPTGIAGLWRVHDAVELSAPAGSAVTAMRDGTVLEVQHQGAQGEGVILDHGDGYIAEYAALAEAADLRPGQRVKAGDAIGRAGDGLRLRVTQEGAAIDPMALLDPSQP